MVKSVVRNIMIKAVIFDLDGVLVHTDRLHYESWKHITDREGIYFNEEINHRMRGLSRTASFDIILEQATRPYSKEEVAKLILNKNDHYQSVIKKLTPDDLASGAKELINALKQNNIAMAIGSSSQNARTILTHLEIIDEFHFISDGHGVINHKPHPEIFNKAAIGLKLDPAHCLVIEDAKAGVDAALAGGFPVVAISAAYNYKNAHYRVENLSEVINIIEQINNK